MYSIGEGYDHYAVFKEHYATKISPVITLSKAGTMFSRLFVALRIIKHAIIKPTADPPLEVGAR